ncbi:PaaX family transcriptional regulator [Ornithinimicrobium avium]|uniref:PaaX family transcriptional regulator n=1 Tax=Ornithinimicrobium avium TaxID=2283195 RepID=UPI0013B37C4E|nr:PaaX family transcriptional regulator C-terminal domain-containing protein [Ornithinimicrobium avium]
MHARSAVVDLYGDHLPEHGWWAPVAGVVALASCCGVQPAATRTAVSRLVRQGWLRAERRGEARGYAATSLARERLAAAHRRIYAEQPPPWDGRWHLVVVDGNGDRRRRDRVAASLGYLGYARLGGATWVSPWVSTELGPALSAHGASWTGWTASPHHDPAALTAGLWDLTGLGAAYRDFARRLPAPASVAALGPAAAFPVRTALVHEWRKFLFRDPALPVEVLPPDWPGQAVRQQFLQVAEALRPASASFVAGVLDGAVKSPGTPAEAAT